MSGRQLRRLYHAWMLGVMRIEYYRLQKRVRTQARESERRRKAAERATV